MIFIAILTGLNLIRYLLYHNTEKDLLHYLGWFVPIAIGLLSLTRVYRSGSNASSPFALIAFLPPIWLIAMSGIDLLIQRRKSLAQKLTIQNRFPTQISVFVIFNLSLLALISALSLISPTVRQNVISLYQNFLSPLGTSRLMQSVMELLPPDISKWASNYRAIFFLFSGGLLFSIYRLGKSAQFNSWLTVVLCELLLINIFYGQEITKLINSRSVATIFYLVSICLFPIGLIGTQLYQRRKTSISDENVNFSKDGGSWLLLTWTIVTLFLTRGAGRYDFFFAPVALIFAAYGIDLLFTKIVRKDHRDGIALATLMIVLIWEIAILKTDGLEQGIAFWITPILLIWIGWQVMRQIKRDRDRFFRLVGSVVLLIFLLSLTVFVPIVGGFVPTSFATIKNVYPFSAEELLEAYDWMKNNLPEDSVIATEWSYGSQINTLAERSTIIDEDHFIPERIHLVFRHVFSAETEIEAVEFLKTHGATHLMIDYLMMQKLNAISQIGSDATDDRVIAPVNLVPGVSENREEIVFLFPGPPGFDLTVNGKTYPKGRWTANKLILTLDRQRNLKSAKVLVDLDGTKNELEPEKIYFFDQRLESNGDRVMPGTFVIFQSLIEIQMPDSPLQRDAIWQAVVLPTKTEPNLMMKLYWNLLKSPHFRQIYPDPRSDLAHVAPVKIWAISSDPIFDECEENTQ